MPLFAIPFPAIDPILIELGPFAIRWYALAYVAGLIGGWLYARRLVRAERLWSGVTRPTINDLDDLLVWCALGVVVGGRLGYVLFYNSAEYLSHPLEILQTWKGGMSFHGGLLGCAVAIVLLARARNLPVTSLFDVAAAVVPIGLFLGRIANFINGELWGRVSDVPWAVVFPHGGPLPRHPSQIYEALTEGLLLFIVLAFVVRRYGFRRPGLITGIFGIGYALSRSFCEFFREPDAQLGYLLGGWATMGMLLSLPVLLFGLWFFVRALRRPAVEAPTGTKPA